MLDSLARKSNAPNRIQIATFILAAILCPLTGLVNWGWWQRDLSWEQQHQALMQRVLKLEQQSASLAEAPRRTSTPSPPPPTIAPSQRAAAQEPRHE